MWKETNKKKEKKKERKRTSWTWLGEEPRSLKTLLVQFFVQNEGVIRPKWQGVFAPHFHSYFLSNLWKWSCSGPRGKIVGPTNFYPPLPLLTKHHFHTFSPLFFTPLFPSSLKVLQPNIALVPDIKDWVEW